MRMRAGCLHPPWCGDRTHGQTPPSEPCRPQETQTRWACGLVACGWALAVALLAAVLPPLVPPGQPSATVSSASAQDGQIRF